MAATIRRTAARAATRSTAVRAGTKRSAICSTPTATRNPSCKAAASNRGYSSRRRARTHAAATPTPRGSAAADHFVVPALTHPTNFDAGVEAARRCKLRESAVRPRPLAALPAMNQLTRRRFLEDSMLAAAATAAAAAVPRRWPCSGAAQAASEKLTVAIIGCGIRGKQHADRAGAAGRLRHRLCLRSRQRPRGGSLGAARRAKAARAEGGAGPAHDVSMTSRWTPSSSHVQPLARPGRHLGHAGGQGRLCREAGQPQRQRRPPHRAGGAQDRPHLPGRNADIARSGAIAPPSITCAKASSAT